MGRSQQAIFDHFPGFWSLFCQKSGNFCKFEILNSNFIGFDCLILAKGLIKKGIPKPSLFDGFWDSDWGGIFTILRIMKKGGTLKFGTFPDFRDPPESLDFLTNLSPGGIPFWDPANLSTTPRPPGAGLECLATEPYSGFKIVPPSSDTTREGFLTTPPKICNLFIVVCLYH